MHVNFIRIGRVETSESLEHYSTNVFNMEERGEWLPY